MKTILTTSTFIIALLAIGIIGINNNNNNIGNAFSQIDSEDSPMMDNRETIEMDDEGMMMSNQSEELKMTNWNGTIDVGTIIAEAFKSKIITYDRSNTSGTNKSWSKFFR